MPVDSGTPANAHAANLLGALGVGLTDLQAAAMSGATGLDPSAVAALATLFDRPGLSIRQLSAVLGITHSGTVRLANRLTSQGLLERGRSADARQVPVALTPDGLRSAQAALRARRDVMRTLLDRLPMAQRVSFVDALATVLGGLPDSGLDARHVCRFCEHACCRGFDCPVGTAAHWGSA
jgi:MarR family transcriptional repressor of emrRAB